jgi:hypothetical protein
MMPSIKLPDVTLIAVDGVARPLTEWVIERTLRLIEPAEVLFSEAIPENAEDADRELWRTCVKAKTSHVLTIQYDGFPIDPSMWKDEFLEYDYIGAVWPHQNHEVGNGGFSLRSLNLMNHMAEIGAEAVSPEDAYICSTLRDELFAGGFRFAPASVAHQFSFERCPKRRAFGFHGVFNLKRVLPAAEFAEWELLANDYVRSKPEWAELMAQ